MTIARTVFLDSVCGTLTQLLYIVHSQPEGIFRVLCVYVCVYLLSVLTFPDCSWCDPSKYSLIFVAGILASLAIKL